MSNASSASDRSAFQCPKRLALRLSGDGVDATFEFAIEDERVRVVGRSAKADFVVVAPGVLPIHAYFERDRHEIWVAPGRRGAPIRLNSTEVAVRAPLPETGVVELGEARLNVTVTALANDAPRMDSQLTAPIDRAALRYALEEFRTASMDASSVFEELPTTEWRRPSTLRPPPSVPADAVLQQTLALPRAVLAVRPAVPAAAAPPRPEQVTQPLPVVPVVPRISTVTEVIKRPFARMPVAPDVWPLAGDAALQTPAVAAKPEGPAPSGPAPQRATALSGTAPLGMPRVIPTESDFVTTSAPIAEIFGQLPAAAPVAPTPTPPKASSLEQVRRILATWERKPIPLIGLLLLLMGTFAALGRQSVLTWRQAHPAIVHAAPSKQARAVPAAMPAPSCSPGAARDEALAAQESSDPLVHEAVQHLVRGRRAEAVNAYAELAARYPTDCSFSVASKVLKQKGSQP
jgi:hypothetical protein